MGFQCACIVVGKVCVCMCTCMCVHLPLDIVTLCIIKVCQGELCVAVFVCVCVFIYVCVCVFICVCVGAVRDV